jgi:uncharacterized coiled-coil protein SlyX
MSDQRTLDRLLAHLRGQVAELRRREGEAAPPEELAERTRLILRLQDRLAYLVRDLLSVQRTSPTQGVAEPRQARRPPRPVAF